MRTAPAAQFGDDRVADAFHLAQPRQRGSDHFRKHPNFAINCFASGFTSRCGIARKSTNSSNS
jgi:hypothetical protein